MTDRAGTGSGLVKLSDSEFVLEDRTQDIRGLDVYDKNGEEIGTVEGLYADTEERKVRFLDVGAGGYLGWERRISLSRWKQCRRSTKKGS